MDFLGPDFNFAQMMTDLMNDEKLYEVEVSIIEPQSISIKRRIPSFVYPKTGFENTVSG